MKSRINLLAPDEPANTFHIQTFYLHRTQPAAQILGVALIDSARS